MSKPPETLDEIPWGDAPPDEVIVAAPRKCRHPREWRSKLLEGGGTQVQRWVEVCRCGHRFDPDVQRRARLAVRRGKDGERKLARLTGARRVGQFGGPIDVGEADDPVAWQSKAGPSYWPTRIAGWLDALASAAHGRPRLIAQVETGHFGRRNRIIVSAYLDELAAISPEMARLLTALADEADNQGPSDG